MEACIRQRTLEECECRFIADSKPREALREGKIIQISFQVRIKPIYRDAANDRNIIDAWQNGGPTVIFTIEKYLTNGSQMPQGSNNGYY